MKMFKKIMSICGNIVLIMAGIFLAICMYYYGFMETLGFLMVQIDQFIKIVTLGLFSIVSGDSLSELLAVN